MVGQWHGGIDLDVNAPFADTELVLLGDGRPAADTRLFNRVGLRYRGPPT